ncbi:hypothetical protein [Burkholderia ambifaria]
MSTKGEAYREAKDSGRISKHETTIMSCFETHPTGQPYQWSREELSSLTDIKVSSICGAVFSLIKKGKLKVVGEGRSDAGAKVQLLGLV